jgi:hypothetical protein
MTLYSQIVMLLLTSASDSLRDLYVAGSQPLSALTSMLETFIVHHEQR